MQDNKDGNTALIFAVQKDNVRIVKLLLKHEADFGKKNKEGKTFNEFAASNKMKSIVLKYGRFLSKLNSDPTQSISPKPLVHKRKKCSSTSSESSYKGDDFKFLIFKRKKHVDQQGVSTSIKPSMRKRRRFSNTSNVSSSQSESSEYRFERSSNGSSVNSRKSSFPESLMCGLEVCCNESGLPEFDLSEPCTSQSAKRMRLR